MVSSPTAAEIANFNTDVLNDAKFQLYLAFKNPILKKFIDGNSTDNCVNSGDSENDIADQDRESWTLKQLGFGWIYIPTNRTHGIARTKQSNEQWTDFKNQYERKTENIGFLSITKYTSAQNAIIYNALNNDGSGDKIIFDKFGNFSHHDFNDKIDFQGAAGDAAMNGISILSQSSRPTSSSATTDGTVYILRNRTIHDRSWNDSAGQQEINTQYKEDNALDASNIDLTISSNDVLGKFTDRKEKTVFFYNTNVIFNVNCEFIIYTPDIEKIDASPIAENGSSRSIDFVPQYYLLYNPIHRKDFKDKYYNPMLEYTQVMYANNGPTQAKNNSTNYWKTEKNEDGKWVHKLVKLTNKKHAHFSQLQSGAYSISVGGNDTDNNLDYLGQEKCVRRYRDVIGRYCNAFKIGNRQIPIQSSSLPLDGHGRRVTQDKMFNKVAKLGPRYSNGRYKEFYGDPLCNIMLNPEQADFAYHYHSNVTDANLLFEAHADPVKGSPRSSDYDFSNNYKFTYGYWNDNFDLKEPASGASRSLSTLGTEYTQPEKETNIETAVSKFQGDITPALSAQTGADVLWACSTHQEAEQTYPSTVLRYALRTVNKQYSNSFVYSLIKAVSNNNEGGHVGALTSITGKDSNKEVIAPCVPKNTFNITCSINYTIFGSFTGTEMSNYNICGNYGGTCDDLNNFLEAGDQHFTGEHSSQCTNGSNLIGCMDPDASNYHEKYTSPGECDYTILGCMDPNATAGSYDSNANTDDGTCEYESGCANPEAENYVGDALAAKYRDALPPLQSLCSFPPGAILGCKNINANNYNSQATVDRVPTLCVHEDPVGCIDPRYEEYDSDATSSDGSCKVLLTQFADKPKDTSYLAIIIAIIFLLIGLYYYLKKK